MNYPRLLEKVYSSLWCITPEAYSAIDEAIRTHVSGRDTWRVDFAGDIAEVTKQEKKPLASVNADMGIGILTIEGAIGKRLSTLESMCGGCDVEKVVAGARQLAANPAVGTIIMDISSPGGVVTGIPEAAEALAEIAKDKTLLAYSDTQMCSAAYWLGSAAHSIYCSKTADLGSIGVYTAVLDRSKQLEKQGINVQAIQAGRLKTEGAPWKPLSEEGLAAVQARVDEVYSDFCAAVTAGRPQVESATMQGQTFRGKRAVEAGLADGQYNSLEALVRAIVDRTA